MTYHFHTCPDCAALAGCFELDCDLAGTRAAGYIGCALLCEKCARLRMDPQARAARVADGHAAHAVDCLLAHLHQEPWSTPKKPRPRARWEEMRMDHSAVQGFLRDAWVHRIVRLVDRWKLLPVPKRDR